MGGRRFWSMATLEALFTRPHLAVEEVIVSRKIFGGRRTTFVVVSGSVCMVCFPWKSVCVAWLPLLVTSSSLSVVCCSSCSWPLQRREVNGSTTPITSVSSDMRIAMLVCCVCWNMWPRKAVHVYVQVYNVYVIRWKIAVKNLFIFLNYMC